MQVLAFFVGVMSVINRRYNARNFVGQFLRVKGYLVVILRALAEHPCAVEKFWGKAVFEKANKISA
jgi:hypothetical protein